MELKNLWNRVISALSKGITSQQTPHGHTPAFHWTILLNCFLSVIATSWHIWAMKRFLWWDIFLIEANIPKHISLKHLQYPLLRVCYWFSSFEAASLLPSWATKLSEEVDWLHLSCIMAHPPMIGKSGRVSTIKRQPGPPQQPALYVLWYVHFPFAIIVTSLPLHNVLTDCI